MVCRLGTSTVPIRLEGFRLKTWATRRFSDVEEEENYVSGYRLATPTPIPFPCRSRILHNLSSSSEPKGSRGSGSSAVDDSGYATGQGTAAICPYGGRSKDRSKTG